MPPAAASNRPPAPGRAPPCRRAPPPTGSRTRLAPGRSSRLRQLLHFLQNLVDMARHLHLAPDAADHALAVDQEGGALDAHIFAAIHALLDPHAVILRHAARLVRDRKS